MTMATHERIPTGRTLTVSYLDHLARLGVDPADLTTHAAASEKLTVAYGQRFLPCPVFLEPGEATRLGQDLLTVHDLLTSLPDRLFDGDRVALGRALGLTETQTALATWAPAGSPTVLARSDLYRAADGFKLLELNITSALGGFENADINRAMLRHPALSGFVAEHSLTYRDTFRAIADTVRHELGDRVTGRRPVLALADWPDSFPTLRRRLEFMTELFDEVGVDAVACHVGQLVERNGPLTVQGRVVDAVYRFFLLEDLPTAQERALVEPVLSAARRGTILLFAGLEAELYGNKGALAMLSDDRHAHVFTAREQDCLRRFLPWTRYVRPRTTGPGGDTVDLVGYATEHRDDLILKPVMLHGGAGIVAGWQAEPAEWAARLADAMDGPWVLQQRVRPAPEPFPLVGGDGYHDLHLNWGVFVADPKATGGDGYAGCIVRGTVDAEVGVVSMGTGALVGCCFDPAT